MFVVGSISLHDIYLQLCVDYYRAWCLSGPRNLMPWLFLLSIATMANHFHLEKIRLR